MRRAFLLLSFAILPSVASAELLIEPLTGNAKAERFEKMRSAANSRSAKEADFPSFQQFSKSVTEAKFDFGISEKQLTQVSASRVMVERLSCKLNDQVPSGVAKKGGGMNGVMSIYLCPNGYLVTYENEYKSPLTQRVTVYDDDYAKRRVGDEPLIKETVATRGNTRFTSLRWLNSENEITYEFFADLKVSHDSQLEKSLKEGLKEVAIRLSSSK
ncbi:hypothetical protein [Pseudomonas sp. NyZ201]|uniref:hypothetical protein n=1 Tax=Pseudomonas sp. NyZ201 TaxID=3409857 RepID=UPI003CEA2A4A